MPDYDTAAALLRDLAEATANHPRAPAVVVSSSVQRLKLCHPDAAPEALRGGGGRIYAFRATHPKFSGNRALPHQARRRFSRRLAAVVSS